MKKVIISDCDGILTDGKSIYTIDGKVGKIYGSYDTEAIKTAHENGWEFIFVSCDKNGFEITNKRINEYYNKGWCEPLQLANDTERMNFVKILQSKGYFVVFVGDSISDILAGKESDYFCTTNNAFDEVKKECNYVSSRDGGNGGFAQIIYHVIQHESFK